MGTVYSYSRLNSFDNCALAFRYRYVDKIKVDVQSIEAFMGKLVHSVIEKLNIVTATGRVPSLPSVLRRYEAMWEESYDPDTVRIVREGTEPDLYRSIGARCTENFYRRSYPFDLDESLGIEEKVMFSLDEAGKYKIRGVVDRITRTKDGRIEIQDYKTGQRVPSQNVIDKDRQLALYHLALRERYPDEPISLVWYYLASDRVRTSERTIEQLEALRKETIQRIEVAERETEFRPKTGPLCGWCEYNDRCEAGRRHLGWEPLDGEFEPPPLGAKPAAEPQLPDAALPSEESPPPTPTTPSRKAHTARRGSAPDDDRRRRCSADPVPDGSQLDLFS